MLSNFPGAVDPIINVVIKFDRTGTKGANDEAVEQGGKSEGIKRLRDESLPLSLSHFSSALVTL